MGKRDHGVKVPVRVPMCTIFVLFCLRSRHSECSWQRRVVRGELEDREKEREKGNEKRERPIKRNATCAGQSRVSVCSRTRPLVSVCITECG